MRRSTIIVCLLILAFISSLVVIQPAASEPLETVKEGRDFATQVLRDPWDMKEYSDVSQFLNSSNLLHGVYLDTVSVADGLFTAKEINEVDAGFFALFPGYDGAVQVGKVGNNHPIPTASFRCLYYAMKVDLLTDNHITGAWWYSDDNWSGAIGKTTWKNVPDTNWHLYKWNLATESDPVAGMTAWTGRSSWIGLKVIPEYNQPATKRPTFTIDWVRLTDCDPVYRTITWSGSGSVTIYLEPAGSGRQIEVATGVTNKAYPLDVQGIEPGDYTYYVKQGGSTLTTGSFKINAAPVITIKKPSMTSGEEFSKTAGNRWDMSDALDVEDEIGCVTESWLDGLMIFDTLDKIPQTAICDHNGSNNDPIFHLNTPGTLDPSQYRYLTYRIYSDGRPISGSDPALYYQDIVNGMIIRYGVALGPDGSTCKAVSNDIPFDVGWNTYSIDLYHGDDGKFEEKTGSCPTGWYWNVIGPIEIMRFDPNENQIGRTLHQELDWIKLTRMDRVKAGKPFTIELKANKPASEITALTYYYTTSLSDPTQNPATAYTPSAHTGAFTSFLAQVTNRYIDEYDPQAIRFEWDTVGVSPADYYICVVADDGKNAVLYCSDAPVKVY
jgi:hypothetical protein